MCSVPENITSGRRTQKEDDTLKNSISYLETKFCGFTEHSKGTTELLAFLMSLLATELQQEDKVAPMTPWHLILACFTTVNKKDSEMLLRFFWIIMSNLSGYPNRHSVTRQYETCSKSTNCSELMLQMGDSSKILGASQVTAYYITDYDNWAIMLNNWKSCHQKNPTRKHKKEN